MLGCHIRPTRKASESNNDSVASTDCLFSCFKSFLLMPPHAANIHLIIGMKTISWRTNTARLEEGQKWVKTCQRQNQRRIFRWCGRIGLRAKCTNVVCGISHREYGHAKSSFFPFKTVIRHANIAKHVLVVVHAHKSVQCTNLACIWKLGKLLPTYANH